MGHPGNFFHIFRNSTSTFGPCETPYIIEADIFSSAFGGALSIQHAERKLWGVVYMVQYECKHNRDSLMKLIWLAIEPDVQNLVDRELAKFSRIPEYHKPASELIRLRSRRRAASPPSAGRN